MQTAVRLFVRDSIEAAVTLFVAMQLTLPASVDDGKRQALIIVTAIAASTWAVFRRVLLPVILEWISPKP